MYKKYILSSMDALNRMNCKQFCFLRRSHFWLVNSWKKWFFRSHKSWTKAGQTKFCRHDRNFNYILLIPIISWNTSDLSSKAVRGIFSVNARQKWTCAQSLHVELPSTCRVQCIVLFYVLVIHFMCFVKEKFIYSSGRLWFICGWTDSNTVR